MDYPVFNFGEVVEGVNISSDPKRTFVALNLNKGNLSACTSYIHQRISCYQTIRTPSLQDLQYYFAWVIAMRVWYVNGKRLPTGLKNATFFVPSFLFNACAALGECYAPDQGLWLIPDVVKEVSPQEGRDQVSEFDPTTTEAYARAKSVSTALFEGLRLAGIEYSDCLPLSNIKGDIELLKFQAINDAVWTESSVPSPNHGMVASLFMFTHQHPVVIPRVRYGTVNQLLPITIGWLDHGISKGKRKGNGDGHLRSDGK